MALLTRRKFADCILPLDDDIAKVHIFEPEFHQKIYVSACENAAKAKGAFQLGDTNIVERYPNRGSQPQYADDEDDAGSIIYRGMVRNDGTVVSDKMTTNVCALKSVSIRWGFLDFGVARSVDKEFYAKKKAKNAAQFADVLINSTGDGTIGRVAVYNRQHPSLVDGHVTIVRFRDKKLAWYTAAYLLSEEGQRQIYRYINGSSGQVEIYPQDIARIWIPRPDDKKVADVAKRFQKAVAKYEEFQSELSTTLSDL
ncbi:hypothetical protein [Nitratireductor rhodophyticola]|uniref:hypothetical protein n=1 Tax=Nitratireductor rhodophyticola TaxID=2854036 RepID=UPI00300A836B